MTTRYEVVAAKSPEEALSAASWKVGDVVTVEAVESVANCDGTYSVFPIIGKASDD